MVLSKEEILGIKDLKTEKVKVPEWNGEVIIRSFTAKERDEFEQLIFDSQNSDRTSPNIRAKFCQLVIVDDEGELMFTPDEIDKLGKKSASALDRIFEQAQVLNGLRQSDLEELEGN